MTAAASRPPSRRDKQLARLKARRAELAARREDMLDDLVSGCNHAFLAQKHAISLRTVRREVNRALDHRQLDPPDRYVRLQVERLHNAIKAIDGALLQGDYLAIDPLLKVIEKLDRYHALAGSAAPELFAPPARLSVVSPPLALSDARDAKDHSSP